VSERDSEASIMRIPGPLGSVMPRRKKGKRIPFIFNDESTGSCICLRLDIYMTHVLLLCVSVIFFNV
jgi:hypothetical protein